MVVKMKVCGSKTTAQLFWAGPGGQANEAASLSLPIVCDGVFHEYRFPVSKKPEWRSRVNHFRFDPVGVPNAKVVIDSVRLVRED